MRKRGTRGERRKILVVTEGTRTEPQYFDGLCAHVRATATQVVSVRTVGVGRDPVRGVREAEQRRAEEQRKGDPFDEVWCVVDVDEHRNLEQALALAGKRGVATAVSNPCFEIWVLWHYADCVAACTQEELRRRLKRHGFSDKNVPRNFPYAAYPDALRRAESPPRCEGNQDPNLSSGVHRVVRAICP
ncbi:RloB family protein [Streptomyces marincola]|uniref:RloB family protein n=1 Tax=Streptomyces marincola TaxID=2878388 RepID=UPI001CF16D1D|nr:RloB family protein [Streptomyces marincola]UCM87544.1 RloB family protein [Streptomyces marincola]